ncbi:MAG: S16 family serine protease [Acidimicrobiia bacterium]
MATVGLLLALVFLASSVMVVDRYADAPGAADQVNDRLAFSAVPRYAPEGEILFVTVAGPHLTGLQAVIGWLDPDVREETYDERFPDRTPAEDREAAQVAMRTAKDDAPYVALTRLGFPTELIPGKVVVGSMLCEQASEDGTRCDDFVPADEFLDPGDEFVAVDGEPILTRDDLTRVIQRFEPGDTVEVVVRRGGNGTAADPGEELTGTVELIESSDEPGRALFGLITADTTQVELPFPIDIDTGRIGGPSAGLAFTLTLLDELTPGELTGGHDIAVTGTIDVNGNVGPIGGLRQKAVAVRSSGASAFIVPAAQSPEDLAIAREILGEANVFPVATVDEALQVLADHGGNALELGTPGADFVPAG